MRNYTLRRICGGVLILATIFSMAVASAPVMAPVIGEVNEVAEYRAEVNGSADSVLLENAETGEIKPGYNIWTGTLSPLDFEDVVLDSLSPINEPEIVDSGDAEHGKALLLNNRGASICFISESFEADRPMFLNYTAKTTDQGGYIQACSKNDNKVLTQWSWDVQNSNWETMDIRSGSYLDYFTKMTLTPGMTGIVFGVTSVIEGEHGIYIDDLEMVPYYKVSYDLGDGTGTLADEYFYADTYTLTADVDSVTAPRGSFFSHWVDQHGNVVKDTVTAVPGEDVLLTAVYKYRIGAPGVNLLSGTPEVQDFEACDISDFAFTNWNPSISSAAIVDDENNGKSLCLTGHYTSMVISDIDCEAERPLYFVYDYKTVSRNAYILRMRANAVNGTDLVWSVTPGSDDWSTLPNQDGFRKIDVIAKGVASAGAEMPDLYWGISGTVTDNVYFDNAAIIPYYKVSYNLGDGNGTLADEYFYADSYTLAADTSDLTSSYGTAFSHWVDQYGNIVENTVTAVPGEDIELTACYHQPVHTLPVASIRVNTPQGIRVAGFVSADARTEVEEYGFVVALSTSFENGDYSTLTIDNDDIKKVAVPSYKKDSLDKIYVDARESADKAKDVFGEAAFDDLGVYFTGVYVGVPETLFAYTTEIVGRTYAKAGDTYYYGEPVSKSVYGVALSIKAKCEQENTEVPQYAIDAISFVESANEDDQDGV